VVPAAGMDRKYSNIEAARRRGFVTQCHAKTTFRAGIQLRRPRHL